MGLKLLSTLQRGGVLIDALTREWVDQFKNRSFYWSPVWFGLGIATYFSLTFEPDFYLLGLCLVVVVALRLILHKQEVIFVVQILAIFLSGLAAAQWRTLQVAAPVLESKRFAHKVEGTIYRAEIMRSGRWRLLLQDVQIDKFAPEKTPRVIRIWARTKKISKTRFVSGQRVSFKARLFPPSNPIYPGAFDLARKYYFEKIGASGIALSHIKVLPEENETNASIFLMAEKWRGYIQGQVISTMGKNVQAGIVLALITGERTLIDKQTYEAVRQAGLAHILAISGLHMMVMAGSLFWFSRLLLAMIPFLALQYPIKKWAAFIALLGAAGYLLISGMSVATQRAFIMLTVMLLAILFDRQALTVRNVILAALIILVFRPESLLSPGFQMSFAATLGLVAVYEMILEYKVRQPRLLIPPTLFDRFYGFFSGIFISSFVAGGMISAIAAYHFEQIAFYGLLANMLVMPIFVMWVMPLIFVSFLSLPFGWVDIPLTLITPGIEAMIYLAKWVASFDGAVWHITLSPISFYLVTGMGLLWLLSHAHVRWILGSAFLLLSVGIQIIPVRLQPLPDIVVSNEPTQFALLGKNTRYLSTSQFDQSSRFLKFFDKADIWKVDNKRVFYASDARSKQKFLCDSQGCSQKIGLYHFVFANSPQSLSEDCDRANILLLNFPLRPYQHMCKTKALVIDKTFLKKNGPLLIYLPKEYLGQGSNVGRDANSQKQTSLGDNIFTQSWQPAFKRAVKDWLPRGQTQIQEKDRQQRKKLNMQESMQRERSDKSDNSTLRGGKRQSASQAIAHKQRAHLQKQIKIITLREYQGRRPWTRW